MREREVNPCEVLPTCCEKGGERAEKYIGHALDLYNQAVGGENFEVMFELGKELAEGRDGIEKDVGRAAE